MYSILHLSDLHRSLDEPVDNNSLIAALLDDRDRYLGETPAVPPPNAIIVSGDLIQGTLIGEANWKDQIHSQYAVAEQFIDELAKRFLGGDRSKIIIVPGNHDVCWNTSFSTMKRLADSEYPKNIRRELGSTNSLYRWNWNERALYQIGDESTYSTRLSAYWEFAERFYQNVPLPLPIDRTRPFQLFELDNRRIVVAAFDSTFGNDCFGHSGAIQSGGIGLCSLHLRDMQQNYFLKMAVWHHSLHGPPLREDYMDVAQVEEMTGHGFQLGLHGHQHVAATTTHYVYLGESKSMAVVSAGSLCAGFRDLPRGINRQYNIIVIEDDFRRARVHVREMTNGLQFTRKNNGEFLKGYVEVTWQAITDALGHNVDVEAVNERQTVISAENALRSGNANRALGLLKNIELKPGSHGRTIAIQAALEIENWDQVIALIGQPTSTQEKIWFILARSKSGDLDSALQLLNQSVDIDPITRQRLDEQIDIQRMLRRTG